MELTTQNNAKEHNNIRNITVCIVAVLTILIACSIAAAGETIIICGTGDSQELLRSLARAYEKGHRGTSITVPDSIGSGGGVRETASGNCDLGRVARPLKKKEEKYNLSYKAFAISPVVFVVNPNVKVNSLTTDEINAIFSGKITMWNEVGGHKGRIYVANREPGDSSRSVLEKKMQGFKDIKDSVGKIIFSTPETTETIRQYKNTIGYTSFASATAAGLKVISRDGVAPSTENVRSGSYQTVSPFGIVWKGELKGLSKSFVDYLYSTEGKKIITQYGAVTVE